MAGVRPLNPGAFGHILGVVKTVPTPYSPDNTQHKDYIIMKKTIKRIATFITPDADTDFALIITSVLSMGLYAAFLATLGILTKAMFTGLCMIVAGFIALVFGCRLIRTQVNAEGLNTLSADEYRRAKIG